MERLSIKILYLSIITVAVIVLGITILSGYLAFNQTPSNGKFSYLGYIFFGGVFITSIPTYIALFQSYKLLVYIDKGETFSYEVVDTLKYIIRSTMAIFIICAVAGLPFFYILAEVEDAPGLVIIGLGITGIMFIISMLAFVFKNLIKKAIELKSENDLTI